jgi:hypothetical protein
VLERMRNSYACLVMDKEKRLVGIITDFDTSEYFQRRAENIMIVEDIERTLKDFILFAYPRAADGAENPDLAVAVQQASAPPRELDSFKRAIVRYLHEAKVELSEAGLEDSRFNPQHAEVAFEVFTARNVSSKAFDDLTMAEYISLFLSDRRWGQYQTAISLEKEAIFQMLDAVRQIRNKLAHFTGEVTETEQEQLRYCLKWLQNYQSKVVQAFQTTVPVEAQPITTPTVSEQGISNTPQKTGDSRYAPLAAYLKEQGREEQVLLGLSFTEIEKIIGASLPPYARKHRHWWANDSVSRVQSKQWIGAGWRVGYVDMENEKVVFEVLSQEKPIINIVPVVTPVLKSSRVREK